MVDGDFMAILFRDILRFAQYPGAPFSGDVLQDLVNYFLFPTIFIIMFIYVIISVLFTKPQAKFRLLVGITLYLVIVVNGWYSTFALFGQFYIVLLILLGVAYFVLAHLGLRIGGSAKEAPGTSEEVSAWKKMRDLNAELESLKKKYAAATADHERTFLSSEIVRVEKEMREQKRKHPLGI